MKKMLILFGKCDWKRKDVYFDEKYRYSYEYLYTFFLKRGIQIYRASHQWCDLEKKVFRYAWTYTQDAGWQRAFNITPDIIYNKASPNRENDAAVAHIQQIFPFFNDGTFESFVNNKLLVSILFSCYCKKNYFFRNSQQVADFLISSADERRVLKPLTLSGGESVCIGTKRHLLTALKQHAHETQQWLLQEFIDSSNGIPDVMIGHHDFRIVIINSAVAYCYYRKPPKGKLISNIALGGSKTIIPMRSVPKSALKLAQHVDQVMATFGTRMYTIDIMFDAKSRPWIVELNTMPGMHFTENEEGVMTRVYRLFYDAVAQEIKTCAL